MKSFAARFTLVAVCGFSATLAACGSDDDGSDQVCEVVPGAWSAPQWDVNAADSLALRAQLDALVGGNGMRGAEQGTVVIDNLAQLEGLYETGDPSLADVTTAEWDGVIANVFDDFLAVLDAGAGDPIDGDGNWVPGPDGGIYGASQRGINAGGLEVRQIADKGMFAGGTLYNYSLGLTEGVIDAGTIDALAAAWGANAQLDPAGELTDSANYSHAMGFHAEIAAALTDAKAYTADANCTDERDDALRAFFQTWEQSMLARLVFYANEAATTSSTATSDDDHIAALHELAEGAGLALGFRGQPDPDAGPLAGEGRIISDSDLDEIADALEVDLSDLNASETGLFIEDQGDFLSAVLAVEAVVVDVYDLSASELQSYRTPTEG